MGEKDTDNLQIGMSGFGVTKKPEETLPEHKQKPLLPSRQTELIEYSKTTPKSVLELINLIEVERRSSRVGGEQKPFKVKMMDKEGEFDNEKIGKATVLFIFLSDKQSSDIENANDHVKKMEELSRELYPPNRKVKNNILEQVGVYLFSTYPHKAINRNLEFSEIREGIDYCLDEKNRLRIKAMVQENRGYELPEHLSS